MTYVQGQRATLSTTVKDASGTLTDATAVLTMTAPDGSITTPTVTHDGVGLYSSAVTFDQIGDWLRVWSTSGTIVADDFDQIHVIAPTLRIVGLAEVKEHGNITSTANDRELLDFIGTAQQMIEELVGPTVPQTFTDTFTTDVPRRYGDDYVRHVGGHPTLWLSRQPVMSVTSIAENGSTVDPSLYSLNLQDGTVARLDRRHWYDGATAVYRAGRNPIPEGIRWAAKELVIHLWRSTQAQRGGRARGDATDQVVAGYGIPNRVKEALSPFLLDPVIG